MYKFVYALDSNVSVVERTFDSEYEAWDFMYEAVQIEADCYYDGDFALAASYYAVVEC